MRKATIGCMMFVFAISTCASDWPQYQHDAQRTGATAEMAPPPYRTAWFRSFVPDDRIHPAVQTVVADGKLFVGTKRGLMYGLDALTGAELWCAQAGGAILHTAAIAGDTVVFGAMDGGIYARKTADGAEAWTLLTCEGPLKHGFSAATLLAGGKVFLPRRDGTLFAVNAADGAIAWTRAIGPVFNAGAAYHDGRVYIGTEDMKLHCLSAADGKTIWETGRVHGQSWGTYCPVVTGGKVIANIMRSVRFSGGDRISAAYSERSDIRATVAGKLVDIWPFFEMTPPYDEMRFEWVQELARGRMPKALAEYGFLDSAKVVEYYRENPHMVNMQVRDEKTGQWQPVAHWRVPMMGGPASPPVLWKDGTLVTGISLFNAMFGRLDLDAGHIVDVLHNTLTHDEFDELKKTGQLNVVLGRGSGNGDETVNLSIGGDIVYAVHTTDMFEPGGTAAFNPGCFDMRSRRWHPMNDGWRHHPYRGGKPLNDKPIIHGDPAYSVGDENRAGGGSPAVIAEGHVYHVTFESTIIARATRTEEWILENFGSLQAEVK